jgi:hypothetical protein
MQTLINEYNYEKSNSELAFQNNNYVQMETDCEWHSSQEEFIRQKFRELKEYLPLEYMKIVVQFKNNNKNFSFTTLKNRFKRIRDEKHLSRIMQIVRDGGTYARKLNEIKEFVWERFKNARENGAPVHDIHFKRWSLIKALELQVSINQSTNQSCQSIIH